MTTEFAFISRLAARVGPAGQVGIGDDAAVLADGTLAAMDTLVADRHFRLGWTEPEDIGWKALAVNLSDLAAMGGEPTAALAAVTLPPDAPGLADRLAEGLVEAGEIHACPLVGGDTTTGPTLVLTVAVLGRMPHGSSPVLRRGARIGDGVYLTAAVGAAATALEALEAGRTPLPAQAAALHRPRPRLAEGRAAATGGATAMIDVSDGLAADLGHLLDASDVGVDLDAAAIPVADGARLDTALGGGDDYELCFTAPDDAALRAAFTTVDLTPPVRIGTITGDDRHLLRDGVPEPLPVTGWVHSVD